MYRVTRPAMNCLFGVTLSADPPLAQRAAADEALLEAERLERSLSRFMASSDIARLNAAAGRAYVLVQHETARLLAEVCELARRVDGAFDPTIGPLARLWRERREPPAEAEIAAAAALVGFEGLAFEPGVANSVGLVAEGMSLDLGGVGKGYAVGRVAGVLAELGVERALVDGGTSSAQALGAWTAAIADPRAPDQPRAVVPLAGQAVAVSGVHGQGFTFDGQWFGHVLDPRTGRPTRGPELAAVRHPSPTVAEVLSTALLVASTVLLDTIPERFPEAAACLWRSAGETVATPNWPGATISQ
jgi:thiamine biosynthesis lipoprotein